MRVAFLVANEGIEQIELTTPWEFLKSEGALVELVAPNGGTARAMNHLSLADEFPVDRTTSQLNVDDFDAVVLPGGVANPDRLRLDSNAVNFLKKMTAASKPIAAICHGPWTLVEGDLVRGRTLTSWPSLRTDIINAGGNWVDEEVKICTSGSNILVTSRNPHDLPAFCDAILGVFTKGISHSA
ncbi:MAG: type 1 glutamine amidotransferase [Actinomycetota bacterium]|nr:MAG: type 1 glutamine amidotransferase [Actinomycetota bacterium]